MYRSSLTLAFVVLCSAAAAASDLPPVYVAPGGIYAPSANVYVRPGPAYRQPAYAEPGYGYRQPSYRAPASVYYGEYGPGYAAQPVYVERPPAYPERYHASERYYAQERYDAQERDYAPEYVPRPPLPVPYRSRARCVVDDGYGGWASCD